MTTDSIKSGRQILDDFFDTIHELNGVDKDVAEVLVKLYLQSRLTDVNLKNELQSLRDRDVKPKN